MKKSITDKPITNMFILMLVLVLCVFLFVGCKSEDTPLPNDTPLAPDTTSNSDGEHSPVLDEDYPVYGDVFWGNSPETVLDAGFRNKQHKWEIVSLVDVFLEHQTVVTLYFGENERLTGGKYQIAFAPEWNEQQNYEAAKKALVEIYGQPDYEDTPATFTDVALNYGTAGAKWDQETIQIDLFISKKDFFSTELDITECEIKIKKDDQSLQFAGFKVGTLLSEVLASDLPWLNEERAQVRLIVPDEMIFDAKMNATYIFAPHDGGKLYQFYYETDYYENSTDVADMYVQMRSKMEEDYGSPAPGSLSSNEEELLRDMHNENQLFTVWQKNNSHTYSLYISLMLDYFPVRKDQVQKAQIRIDYGSPEATVAFQER